MSSLNFEKTKRKNFKCVGEWPLPSLIKASPIGSPSPTHPLTRFQQQTVCNMNNYKILNRIESTWIYRTRDPMINTCHHTTKLENTLAFFTNQNSFSNVNEYLLYFLCILIWKRSYIYNLCKATVVGSFVSLNQFKTGFQNTVMKTHI